ncbi:hypothetical protein E2C01_077256 [Portunus trituberculatus]|uniref:Uncharacterized protein n=1 Tax=Portunus trituberculatus TaxID=210409 RepID=A0A5B7IFD6_PORTR|nr:hypothetical protein [Portunus trituberculatus]
MQTSRDGKADKTEVSRNKQTDKTIKQAEEGKQREREKERNRARDRHKESRVGEESPAVQQQREAGVTVMSSASHAHTNITRHHDQHDNTTRCETTVRSIYHLRSHDAWSS